MTDSASVSKYENMTKTALQFHMAQSLTLSLIMQRRNLRRGLKYYTAKIQHKELHQQTLNYTNNYNGTEN